MTREVATVSNGAIARCRIINASRSGGAPLMIHVKLGLDVPLSKIELFKSAVRKFIEERPQELYRTVGFRLTRVEVDLEFVEYVVVVQSRSSRAETNAALESKRMVASFCLEVQKKLNIRYTSPP